MVVHGKNSLTESGGRSVATDHNRLEIVRLLIKAEADPTSIAASHGGAHSPLTHALDSCESYVIYNELHQVRLRVEENALVVWSSLVLGHDQTDAQRSLC